jgi:hypothetical protein
MVPELIHWRLRNSESVSWAARDGFRGSEIPGPSRKITAPSSVSAQACNVSRFRENSRWGRDRDRTLDANFWGWAGSLAGISPPPHPRQRRFALRDQCYRRLELSELGICFCYCAVSGLRTINPTGHHLSLSSFLGVYRCRVCFASQQQEASAITTITTSYKRRERHAASTL